MRLITLAIILVVSVPAMAVDWGRFEADFDEAKPWNELEAQFPGAPQEVNLVRIDLGPAARHDYFLDRASISTGSDGVVRYTLIARSTGGARTVNFEGMRCVSGESKLYAFGRPDGTWSRNKNAAWARIKDREIAGYQRELFAHYFCTVDGPAEMKVITKALRQGGVRRGDSHTF
jgi:hypothetical protein